MNANCGSPTNEGTIASNPIAKIDRFEVEERPLPTLTLVLIALLSAFLAYVLIANWEAISDWLSPAPTPQPVQVSCPSLPPPYVRAEGEARQGNDPERRIRELRHRAWRGDFFAQMALGDIYDAAESVDKTYTDPTEASVWFAMALANSAGYVPVTTEPASVNTCRSVVRQHAYERLYGLLAAMSTDEIREVRDRVTYILASQGPKGLLTLARINDEEGYGPFGEPVTEDTDNYSGASPFSPHPIDAWVFYFLAAEQGDAMAQFYLEDFQKRAERRGDGTPSDYSRYGRQKAYQWSSPFEVYPGENDPHSPSSLPYTDETCTLESADQDALYAIDDAPPNGVPANIKRGALRYLGYLRNDKDLKTAVRRFQAAQRLPETGEFTPDLESLAIELAAIRGSAEAQTALGVMYTKGVGVCRGQSYARAYEWFKKAAAQRAPAALYALSRYFDEGVAGVANQNIGDSVAFNVNAAAAGFWPSEVQFKTMLARAGRGRRQK